MRLVDALYASGKFQEAAAVLSETVAKDHSFKTIPEYKVSMGGGCVIDLLQRPRCAGQAQQCQTRNLTDFCT